MGILCVILLYIFVDRRIVAHDVCWNHDSPVSVFPRLTFCTEFAAFGCCTKDGKEKDIKAQIKYFNKAVPYFHYKALCLSMIKELMCQKCSRFSAHIFDFNFDSPLPGMCSSYCSNFYSKCSKFIKTILKHNKKSFKINIKYLSKKKNFCSYFSSNDPDYCFPGLRANEYLTGEISNHKIVSRDCLCLKPLTDDILHVPVQIQHANDGSHRIYVAVLPGVIYSYYSNATQTQTPHVVLDIRENVFMRTAETMGDIGFLGFTFHPRFSQNGKLYVVYSVKGPGFIPSISRVSEFTVPVNHNNGPVGIKDERVIMDIPVTYHHHVGGQLLFGDDGYLYIFMGDAAKPFDPDGNAQNMTLLLGKALRIDIEGTEAGKPYRIPPDNPFVHDPSVRSEIYAYGLRSPWRCGKDRGDPVSGKGKGRIICADVGEWKYEEIDLIKKGANYGWNMKEGPLCHKKEQCKKGKLESPIYSYDHSVGKSISGGMIYRGCQLPHLQGGYIYGDWTTGRLFKLLEDSTTGQWENQELFLCNKCPSSLSNTYLSRILSINEDEQGEIYITTMNDLYKADGKVFKVVGLNGETDCAATRPVSQAMKAEDEGQTTNNVKEEMQKAHDVLVTTGADGLLTNTNSSQLHVDQVIVEKTKNMTDDFTVGHKQTTEGHFNSAEIHTAKDNQTTAEDQASNNKQGKEPTNKGPAITNKQATDQVLKDKSKEGHISFPTGLEWLASTNLSNHEHDVAGNPLKETEELSSSYGPSMYSTAELNPVGSYSQWTTSNLTTVSGVSSTPPLNDASFIEDILTRSVNEEGTETSQSDRHPHSSISLSPDSMHKAEIIDRYPPVRIQARDSYNNDARKIGINGTLTLLILLNILLRNAVICF